MNIKCRNLSELRCFEKIRLAAGSGGLDNIITWVYINQSGSIRDWIHGGELVFITGMEEGFSEEMLISVIKECIENAAAGIVILLNPEHIRSIPEKAAAIADDENMPLYEMPWDLKLVDVTKEIADTIILNQLNERSITGFFSELLFARHISPASVKSMGIHCGVDMDSGAAMMIIRPICSEECKRTEFDNIISALMRLIDNKLYSKGINFISCISMDEIFGYIVCENSEKLSSAHALTEEICADFTAKHRTLKIYGGIGRPAFGTENFRKSYHDARQALEISENSGNNSHITLFSQLGIISLLASSGTKEELKDYCYSTLMPLIDSDSKHNTEYVKTLEAYLKSNCNLVKAAESMYIHRNTMVYRIEKIRSLLDIDFNDMTAKSECMNVLRIIQHFGIKFE